MSLPNNFNDEIYRSDLPVVFKFGNFYQSSLSTSTEGPRLMRISLVRISLLRFFKTFLKYLPYANFWLFISLVQFFAIFAQKIALMK